MLSRAGPQGRSGTKVHAKSACPKGTVGGRARRNGSRGGTSSSPAGAAGSAARSPSGSPPRAPSLTLLARDLEALSLAAAELGAAAAACDIRDRAGRRGVRGRCRRARPDRMRSSPTAGSAGRTRTGREIASTTSSRRTSPARTTASARRCGSLAAGPETRHVVVISSILARIPVAGYTGYSASKAGLLGLVRSLAAELAPENVQVNAICPGWVNTDMAWSGLDGIAEAIGGTRDDAYREAMSEVPLGRMGEPADVAGTVAWLLSDDARGVTGPGDRPERRRLDGLRTAGARGGQAVSGSRRTPSRAFAGACGTCRRRCSHSPTSRRSSARAAGRCSCRRAKRGSRRRSTPSTGSSSRAAPTSTRPSTGTRRIAETVGVRPERDRGELALLRRRSSATCPCWRSAAARRC